MMRLRADIESSNFLSELVDRRTFNRRALGISAGALAAWNIAPGESFAEDLPARTDFDDIYTLELTRLYVPG